MSLSYYYEFIAPASTTAEELEEFLRDVERLAKSLGFAPTLVLNVPFDTPERRDFSRRLGGGFNVQDECLKGGVVPAAGQLRDHDPIAGEGQMVPEHGIVLVVTDETGAESCFGFFKFPERVVDTNDRTLAETGLGESWWFRDFVDSPDPRYRQIVERFWDAGYVKRMHDEFA